MNRQGVFPKSSQKRTILYCLLSHRPSRLLIVQVHDFCGTSASYSTFMLQRYKIIHENMNENTKNIDKMSVCQTLVLNLLFTIAKMIQLRRRTKTINSK